MSDSDDDEPPLLVNLESADTATATKPVASTSHPETTAETLPPCPVTILSGFLGSGKIATLMLKKCSATQVLSMLFLTPIFFIPTSHSTPLQLYCALCYHYYSTNTPGKTTLIQYILKSPDHKKRIAVIENEFGEGLAIESLIAKDGMEDQNNNLIDLIELPNGCVCCTVKDSLVATLESLLDKRQDLDYILIEASGMANPGVCSVCVCVLWLLCYVLLYDSQIFCPNTTV